VRDARIGLLGYSMGASGEPARRGPANPSVKALGPGQAPYSDLRQVLREEKRAAAPRCCPADRFVGGPFSLWVRLRHGIPPVRVEAPIAPAERAGAEARCSSSTAAADLTTSDAALAPPVRPRYRWTAREIWNRAGHAGTPGGLLSADRPLYVERVGRFSSAPEPSA